MIVLLADNHLAYRGTLTDMCEFLDVASRDSRTNAKIKTAIENLEKSGKIKRCASAINAAWTGRLL